MTLLLNFFQVFYRYELWLFKMKKLVTVSYLAQSLTMTKVLDL